MEFAKYLKAPFCLQSTFSSFFCAQKTSTVTLLAFFQRFLTKLRTVSVNQSLIMLIKLYLLTSTAQNKGEKLGRIPMLEYVFEKVNKVVGSRSAALFKKRLYHT